MTLSRLSLALLCASMIAGLWGCSDDDEGPTRPDPPTDCGRLVVVTSDYATGSVSVAEAGAPFTVRRDVAAVHADAVARVFGGLVYVVNRGGGDNVQVLDPGDDFATTIQFTTGAGTNPHDIWVLSATKAYVALYGSAVLLEVDPGTGNVRDEISLAGFADPDGIPDMDRLFYREPYLYVSLERIDFGGGTYQPVAPSMLAVIDTRTNALVDANPAADGIQAIALAGLNPIAPMVWDAHSGSLLVPEAGAYGVLDGGIEMIDLDSMGSAGFLATEQELGGDLMDFAVGAGSLAYAAVSDGSRSYAVAFDRTSGAKVRTVHASQRWVLLDLIVTPCGNLIVGDPDYETPGLRIYDAGTGDPVAGLTQPIATGLPPVEIVYLAP